MGTESIDWKGHHVLPTNQEGHYTYAPPPHGFDPLKAKPDVLRQHGFPLPPDPRVAPDAFKLWKRVVRRVRTFVQPELRPRPRTARRPRLVRGGQPFSLDSDNWAGAIVTPAPGLPVKDVFGQWTVPSLGFGPGAASGSAAVVLNPQPVRLGIWVGIDGTTDDNGGDLLQAGTGQYFVVGDAFGQIFVINSWINAWFEWLPNPPFDLTNFPIMVGDTIAVRVAHLEEIGAGAAFYLNMTTGAATSVLFNQSNYVGSTAEWIVEAPSQSDGGTTIPTFGTITFTNIGAHSTVKNALIDTSTGESVNIVGVVNGTTVPLVEGAVIGSGAAVQCTFLASFPPV